jgi:hypothetical protein
MWSKYEHPPIHMVQDQWVIVKLLYQYTYDLKNHSNPKSTLHLITRPIVQVFYYMYNLEMKGFAFTWFYF